MCRHRLRCIVTCGVVLLFSVQIRAQDIVRDEAQLLSPQEEQRLAYALRAYADSTSNQIIVRTVQTLEGADIATYATELGQSLGVGQADKDNGVVIVVAVEEREVFIAVGYGLEGVIPDVLASRIVRDIITPNFRHGQFYTGLAAACDALMLAAAGEYQADPVSVRRYAAADDDTFGLIFFLIVIGLAIAITALRHRSGPPDNRRRNTDGVIPLMFLLGHMSGRGSAGFGGSGFGGGGGFGGGFGGGGFGGGGAGGSW